MQTPTAANSYVGIVNIPYTTSQINNEIVVVDTDDGYNSLVNLVDGGAAITSGNYSFDMKSSLVELSDDSFDRSGNFKVKVNIPGSASTTNWVAFSIV